MGTWGTGIKDNDTSYDVYESFYEQYNQDIEISEIKNSLLDQFADSLRDEEDKDNVLLPLSLCLWETGALDPDLYTKIKNRIEMEDNIEVWKALAANNDDIKKRRKVLEKFLDKISKPKEKPKARRKPPVKIVSKYNAGCCLSFKYPNGQYGGAVIIDGEFYKNKGNMRIAITDINQNTPPKQEDFETAKLVDFQWEQVWGQAHRFAAKIVNGIEYTGRIYAHSINYSDRQARDSFFAICDSTFTIVTQYPAFTQVLLGTTWIAIENLADGLDWWYHNGKNKSAETIKELTPILSSCSR